MNAAGNIFDIISPMVMDTFPNGDSGFSIASTTIPRGTPFLETGTGWYNDSRGLHESVNPVANGAQLAIPFRPLANGKPAVTGHDANFGFISFLYESDNLSLQDQIIQASRLVSLNVVNMIVFSGGKSLHMRVTVKDVPKNKEEYKWLWTYITKAYDIKGADGNCKNNGRKLRAPGAARRIEIDGITHCIEQTLIHQSGVRLDFDWRSVYEGYKIKQQKEYELSKQRAAYYKSLGLGNYYDAKWKQDLQNEVDNLLNGFTPDNRNNVLYSGLIPKMVKLGYSDERIWAELESRELNHDLRRTVKNFLRNARIKHG
ncbi:MAG: hypothetical protein FWG80_02935 [Alphaproteobacteria bacterium]|nr:hypothetical protein [Alphaproteobacteria bacterium]